MSTGTRLAKAPFEIYTLAHVSRMGGRTANTLRELAYGLETCSDESIYHHTIVAMRSHLLLADNPQTALRETPRRTFVSVRKKKC